MLRNHRILGLQKTSLLPARMAHRAVKANASPLRDIAITCQSHTEPSACVVALIKAKEKLPHNIHRYGRVGFRGTGGFPRDFAFFQNKPVLTWRTF